MATDHGDHVSIEPKHITRYQHLPHKHIQYGAQAPGRDDVVVHRKTPGKIFLDHNQNIRGKNMASIYSLRPLMGAPVSTPLRWDELEDMYPIQFTIESVPDRIEKLGDLWAGILDAKHDLGRLLGAES